MKEKTKARKASPLMIIGVLLICFGLLGLSIWLLTNSLSDIGADRTVQQQSPMPESEQPEKPEEETEDDGPVIVDTEVVDTLPEEEDPPVEEEQPPVEEEQPPVEADQPEEEPVVESGYLLESDKKLLTEEDVAHLTDAELRLARNEIYARHGRRFNAQDLQSYFDSQDWYNGAIDAADFDESVLSPIEQANAEFLRNYENSR